MDKTDESSEWETVKTVSGPGALALFRASMANFVTIVVVSLLFAVVQIQTNAGFTEIFPTLLFVVIVLQTCVLIPSLYYFLRRQLARELVAGYTTTYGAFPEVCQADRRTGLVIRPIGHAAPSPEERVAQRLRVAEYKRHLSPN